MPDDTASYRLTNLDASFLYQESTISQMHGGGIFFLRGEIPFEKFFSHVQSRLHITPRYRQRLVFPLFNLAHPTLEDDPDFKLENHVQRRQLPEGISEAGAIDEIVRYNNSRMLDRNRPLWCMTLFQGMPGRSLILSEMHHCLVDGVSGFDMFNRLMDFTPNPEPVEVQPVEVKPPASLPTTGEVYVRALRDLIIQQLDSATRTALEFVRDPMGGIRQAQELADSMRVLNESTQRTAVATPWNTGVVTQERRVAWLKFPFDDFRAMRHAFGGTINDLVLTLLSEAAARYLKDHGWPTDGNLRIGCPVNVRRPGEQITLENRVSIMMPMMPARPMDLIERLQLIVAETKRQKEAGLPYVIDQMTSANPLPPALAAAVGRVAAQQMEASAQFIKATNWRPSPSGPYVPVTGINFMATNVPGPQTAWYLGGHEVTEMVGVIPLAGNLGLGVVITSYNQQLIISLTVEPRLLPDVDRFRDFIQETFEELRKRLPKAAPAQESKLGRVAA
ncbi:MAG: wax ester/triacylglycerol synthase family O-acyltransferase [Deltaproteobacteria bacterium]|nr:wax ester/triacylglycerol synthase family O-acyltransferase [Deltaproteobacteria bacterium]